MVDATGTTLPVLNALLETIYTVEVSHLFTQSLFMRIKFFSQLRRGFFYLLDYVTSAEIFQIGNRKKKEDMDPIYRNFY